MLNKELFINYCNYVKNVSNQISINNIRINDYLIFIDFFNDNNRKYHFNYFMKVINITSCYVFFEFLRKEVKDSDQYNLILYENVFLINEKQDLFN